MLYEGRRLFQELSERIEQAFGIEKDTFGALDIAVSGKDIPMLKVLLEQLLKDKLQVFKTFEVPNTSETFFGKEYKLDTRNEEHNAIRTLAMLLRMVDREVESGGSIWFYEHGPVDKGINRYVLSVFKAAPEGIEQEAAFAKLRERFDEFADLKAEEFADRIEELKAHNFLIDKEGTNQLLPSRKTLRINSLN